MTHTLHINRLWVSLGIPVLIMMFLLLLAKSAVFDNNISIGSFAITFDLLITIPLVYFLLIRKGNIPVTTVAPVFIAGLIAGTYILPVEQQQYLRLFKIWALPVVELLVLFYIIHNVRRSIRAFHRKKGIHSDFFTIVKEICSELVPQKLVPFFATEIAVLYYGFLHWGEKSPRPNEFTYHKTSGTTSLIGAFIFIVLFETIALHLLLAQWSNGAAWILTAFSTYTAVQLFGILKSFSQRPMVIQNNTVLIRYGILAETEIMIHDIEEVKITSNGGTSDERIKKLSPFGELEHHNVIIRLKHEYVLSGFYGMRKTFTHVALFVDKKEEFKNTIEHYLQENVSTAGNFTFNNPLPSA